MAKSGDINLHCGDLLRSTLATHGLRGGGTAEFAQTDVPKEWLEKISAELEDSVGARCRLRGWRPQPDALPS